jgi:hypothetical protein
MPFSFFCFVGALYVAWVLFYVGLFSVRTIFLVLSDLAVPRHVSSFGGVLKSVLEATALPTAVPAFSRASSAAFSVSASVSNADANAGVVAVAAVLFSAAVFDVVIQSFIAVASDDEVTDAGAGGGAGAVSPDTSRALAVAMVLLTSSRNPRARGRRRIFLQERHIFGAHPFWTARATKAAWKSVPQVIQRWPELQSCWVVGAVVVSI